LGVEAAARGAAITQLVLLESPLPATAPARRSLARTGQMIRNGRRGDAVASFLAGVGLPPEAVEGDACSRRNGGGLEAMAHTLLYDGAIV
jgi:hypothetical protein